MKLVEIDVVCTEPPQAVLAGLEYVLGPGTFSRIVYLHAKRGRNHDIVAFPAKRATQEFFALRAAVDVGSVEKIDALGERCLYYLCCGVSVEFPSEVVASDADDGYVEGANSSFVHRRGLPLLSGRARRPFGFQS
jgi:hypothetical protein